jgi:hypothetical protein
MDVIKKKKREDGLTPPSTFTQLKTTVTPPFLTHYQRSSTPGTDRPTYLGFDIPCTLPGQLSTLPSPSGGWASLEPTTAEITQSVLSSNPFRYEVSVPVMIAELLEVSSLFKLNFRSLSTATGSSFLNIKFGWETLIADIKSLSKILKSIESRIQEFNSLVKKGGSRRYCFVSKKRVTENYSPSSGRACYSASYSTWYSDDVATYTSKVWGTVRWKPQRDKVIEVERLIAARKELTLILFGLERNVGTQVWEAIPFSWLIDYFLGVGDIFKALENTDLVIPYDICVMREREVIVSVKVRPKNRNDSFYGYSYATPGKMKYVQKNRQLLTPSEAYTGLLGFGILNQNQALTIMALLLSRRKNSKWEL